MIQTHGFTRTNHLVRNLLLVMVLMVPVLGWAQNTNSSLSGQVTDPSGASVPNVQLTLRSVATEFTAHFTTGTEGLYSFQNLTRGAYELSAKAQGFQDFEQSGISLNLNENVRVDVKLQLGSATQTVEVVANASPLNFENASVKQAITPNEIAQLPLLVSGMKRNVVNFAVLMPGVTTGANNSVENARTNGGMQWGDESTLDGVTMQEGLLNQSGMISFFDMPIAPEVVDEVSIVGSTYEPQYGMTTSAVLVVTTKSGSNAWHGGAYEFNHNTDYNSRPFGVATRPKDNENDFGAFIGGPAKIPKVLWDAHRKTYFFFSFGGFRSVGTVTKPIYSFPTQQERQGDFSDYVDSVGKLIPIFDPNTTAPLNPGLPLSTSNVTRTQFACGAVLNVICPNDPRLAASLAQAWLTNVPIPNRSGLFNNYEAPVGVPTSWENQNRYDIRVDHYIGTRDHVSITEHYGQVPAIYESGLPFIISTDSIRNHDHYHTPRINWDHTISPSLLNHFAIGYLDWYTHQYDFSDCCLSKMPQISGVWAHTHQPQITFDQYSGYGNNGDFTSTRPEYALNDMLTWIHGKHTLKVGAEGRYYAYPQYSVSNGSGTFTFTKLNTGLPGINSGNDMASFLLGYVGNASSTFYTATTVHPQDEMISAYAGDTWKVTPKLSLNYGVRWDLNPPSKEKNNKFAFFDPIRANPDAGGLPGAEVFAGSQWGTASFGRRYPENIYYHAFAPRIGVAYSVTPKTVVRTGYGIFFDQAFYPGWAGGIGIDGFNENVVQPSSFGGLTPSFLLQNGFPQNFTPPPNLTLGADNGLSVSVGNYRPFDANRLPYAQQWNLTVEHQFTPNFYVSAAYVGNKGTRLPSAVVALNALNPSLLSMGSQLFDQFAPGDTAVDGVNAPYAGWASQMRGCSPTVAQALSPYPQYCGGILGDNENAGNSTYHSFQFKAERRFSNGTSMLLSYTNEKTITSSDNTQAAWVNANSGAISPYQRWRNKALASDDVPQTLSLALTYQLPVGKNKRFLNQGGPLNAVVGGWELTSVLRLSSGVPLQFRNGSCNLPGQFAATCLPGAGSSPFAQTGSFDSTKPLLNVASFQPTGQLASGFSFGSGSPVSGLRGYGFYNNDYGLVKEINITERVRFQFRFEFFNAWNWHTFENNFNTDVSSANFGLWNGGISNPRNIQMGGKILF
ncbi:MAG TPA: carboxypeptidase regulatory-like domain-containing protein [Terriglobia bacterium]|nr:carboxypeptidase regulatory-like domain-containing protein [Terriglobia bacterium]